MSTYRAKIINLECPITRRFALGTVGASLIALLTGCTESVDFSSTAFDPYGADQVYPALSDIVRFGTYPQGAEEPEPIEWLVLEERDSKTLLLAKRALDYKSYDNEGGDVTWESCTLRSWLNSDFLSQAFTKRELECVVETRIVNADNEKCGTDGGGWTRSIACFSSARKMWRCILVWDSSNLAWSPAWGPLKYPKAPMTLCASRRTMLLRTAPMWMTKTRDVAGGFAHRALPRQMPPTCPATP